MIVVGISVIVYPKITDFIYHNSAEKAMSEFTAESKQTDTDRLYELLKQKNEELYLTHQADLSDPFSYSQADIDLSEYGINDGIIAYVAIPKIDETMPVILGASSENLTKGAVHLTNTSYPIGGVNTNSVIAAHRGWSRAKMLRNIDKLEIGDTVYIENFRETLEYRVSEIEIIDPDDINKLLIRDGKDMISLITCHPYRVNTHRYVVFCERVM